MGAAATDGELPLLALGDGGHGKWLCVYCAGTFLFHVNIMMSIRRHKARRCNGGILGIAGKLLTRWDNL